MTVYILEKCYNLSDESTGASAFEHRVVIGVFGERAVAEARKEKAEAIDKQDVQELETDPCIFEITPWTVSNRWPE